MSVSDKTISLNILGSLLVKAGSMGASLAIIPALLAYFGGDKILVGTWLAFFAFTSIGTSLDLGLGNRLKNDILSRMAKNREYAYLIRDAFLTQTVIAILLVTIIISFVLVSTNIGSAKYQLFQMAEARPELFLIAAALILLVLPFRLSLYIWQAKQYNAWSSLIAVTPQFGLLAFATVFSVSEPTIAMTLLACVLLIGTAATYLMSFTLIPQAQKALRNLRLRCDAPIFFWRRQKQKIAAGSGFFVIQLSIIFLYSYNEVFYLLIGTVEDIVHYQYYFRPFSLYSVGFSIVALPFWSAMRLAYLSENVVRVRKLFITIVGLNIPVAILLAPFFYYYQNLLNFWLGNGAHVASDSMLWLFSSFALFTCLMHAFASILSAYDLIAFQAKTLCIGLLLKISYLSFFGVSSEIDPVMISTIVGLTFVVVTFACRSFVVWKTLLSEDNRRF